jgi:crossover junction endodeoxyribonuclease RuvC
LDRWAPDAAAVESPFHGRNSRSLIVLAQARGALLATLSRRGLAPAELSPAQVKSAVAGYGRAEKAQVATMVGLRLGLRDRLPVADSADALAVAICYAEHSRSLNRLTGRDR